MFLVHNGFISQCSNKCILEVDMYKQQPRLNIGSGTLQHCNIYLEMHNVILVISLLE